MRRVLLRLREPSTWSGLAGIMVLYGMTQDEWMRYVAAITGGLGFLAAVVFPERGGRDE